MATNVKSVDPESVKYMSTKEQDGPEQHTADPENLLIEEPRSCQFGNCAGHVIVILAEGPCCLEHFLQRCYERLDRLEPLVRGHLLETTGRQAAGTLLEECSNRALLVSLRETSLTNHDRSRLLDILLWTGDLQHVLRHTGPGVAYNVSFASPARRPPVMHHSLSLRAERRASSGKVGSSD